MKGLEVRMARALNKVMHRKGAVFADRYHSHVLASPSEAHCLPLSRAIPSREP
jgi:hypothetical protein